jgi:polyisoprenoid-binding protein YceI
MSTIRHFITSAVVFVAALHTTVPACAEPVTYTIGTKLSRVSFTLMHQGFIELVGTVRVAPGQFIFDNDNWNKSSAVVSMPTRSIDLGDARWNQMLRDDEEWTNLFKYPSISFKMTRLTKTDATSGKLIGELTLAGKTRTVALDMKVNKIGLNDVSELPSIGFTASTTVKRSDFGIDAYSDLVGDQLGIKIQIEAAAGKDPDADRDQTAPGVM